MATSGENEFVVWGNEQKVYGPVEVATLLTWVKEGRVTSESWVYAGNSGAWQRARAVPELKRLFTAGDTVRLQAMPQRIEANRLRHIKVLSSMTDQQLEMFSRLVEIEETPPGAIVVSLGQREESLYFIFEGELRVYLPMKDTEVTLALLTAGDFFGDMALLSHGARSATVKATTKCLLGRLSAAAFQQISERAVETAARFLQAVDQTLAERIRADNERLAGLAYGVQQT